ncbi:hypothetical protein [Shewanella salipaludis]|uniref:Uncharacterized protein n=1 Tax=Shewanella salipaludis TaxID=2723052 RepID=A0A972G161_9GAMM|nr:hypothetical protein [Shewanella salipaludis]NMH65626.1 hypothetical protein [Shewanella salipaludis]
MKAAVARPSGVTIFQTTAVFSMLFALIGFSYNVWRMEVTETNATLREASFEMLLQLSELELNVYAAYYDQDAIEGNPRRGWVKVGLIEDLSMIMPAEIRVAAKELKRSWSEHWPRLPTEETSAISVVTAIDATRAQVRQALAALD